MYERHLLELMQGWPFAVTFNACITLTTSHSFDLSCFHPLTEDSDSFRLERVVCEIRLAPGSLCYVLCQLIFWRVIV